VLLRQRSGHHLQGLVALTQNLVEGKACHAKCCTCPDAQCQHRHDHNFSSASNMVEKTSVTAGSRLPAPLAWPLLEVWHAAAGSPPSDAVGAALMWVLALEASGSRYMAAIPTGGRPRSV